MTRIAIGFTLVCFAFASLKLAHAEDQHAPIGDAINNVPIVDTHMHYKERAWEPYPVKTVIELMDKNGVSLALVSSTPDDGTIRLWEYAPDRIIPELRPYHGDAGSSNWTKSDGMLDYLKQRLDKYPHEGIGEFHIHQLDMDDRPFLTAVAKMAKTQDLPLHIHSGAEPVRFFFDIEPELTIIWAHAGMSEPASIVGQMLDDYKNLYADTSYRENDILSDGRTIDPAWRSVILKHSDRLMIGTDTWTNSQWEDYDGLIATNRLWLSQFSREIAEKIAHKNALKLFKREHP